MRKQIFLCGVLAGLIPMDYGQGQVGSKIAFLSMRDDHLEIYTMSIDGGDPVNLTRHPAADFAPSWSPAAQPYARLIWLHRVLLGLGALAIVSFAVHGYHWLTLPV